MSLEDDLHGEGGPAFVSHERKRVPRFFRFSRESRKLVKGCKEEDTPVLRISERGF